LLSTLGISYIRKKGHNFETVYKLIRYVFDAKGLICFVQRLPFVDVATGSLGQGLSCAAGMAYVGKYVDKAQ